MTMVKAARRSGLVFLFFFFDSLSRCAGVMDWPFFGGSQPRRPEPNDSGRNEAAFRKCMYVYMAFFLVRRKGIVGKLTLQRQACRKSWVVTLGLRELLR